MGPSPRVVILGTSTGFANGYFTLVDNVQFSKNVFAYLSGYPVLLEPGTWGAIKAMND